MEHRAAAKEFAKNILRQLNVPETDVLYLEAVLVEAALFEIPLRDLKIAINDAGHMYHITIRGYENVVDMVHFVNTFMGNKRGMFLNYVVGAMVHMTDKAIILQMDKVRFVKAADGGDGSDAAAAASSTTKKRMVKRPA